MERAIKYYQSLSKLLTWWLRYSLAEPKKTQAFKLRDHAEEQLDYLVSLQEEKIMICM